MKVGLIVPYFGKFPNYFQLVLNSCAINKSHYEWIFFTDDKTEYVYPDNVKVFNCTFQELKEKIQKKFDFKISLDNPYKLCDYKPAYGFIFEEYLVGYDFWGHCDIDCIYGVFDNFLREDAFLYDKILRLGHLTLYRNNKDVNRRFMLSVNGKIRYKEVYTTSNSCIFDEENSAGTLSIRDIWKEYDFSEYCADMAIANVYYKSDIFRLNFQQGDGFNYFTESRKRSLFIWDKGQLLRYWENNGELVKKEYMYLHMMRRKMQIKVNPKKSDIYKIIPNAFEEIEKLPENLEEYKSQKWHHFNLQYPIIRIKNLKSKIQNYKNKRL